MKAQVAIPVLHVKDLSASVKFYVDLLGFTEELNHSNYSGLKLGKAEIHLFGEGGDSHPPGRGTVYVICDEVDGYYAELKAKGVPLQSEPTDQFYGLRDFHLKDPDGNHLSFGCPKKS